MKKIELLAPAGDYESLIAAIQAGADALYVGYSNFSARSFAKNFDEEELSQAVNYVHIHEKKLYLTLNTLIFDDEFKDIEEIIQLAIRIKIDALIIQDLGLIRFIKKNYPNITVHASTQMNIYSPKGIAILKKMGVERIIISRETPLSVIKEMTKEDMEIETFIHGALCYSSSGNCYLSSLYGDRSANRGKCAQPCRMNYSLAENGQIIVNDKPLISMRDLNTINHIPELIETGLTSLKIEGRMKSKDYVYTVVSTYRKAIDEYYKKNNYKLTKNDDYNLNVTFNRKFTEGNMFKKDNYELMNKETVNHNGVEIGSIIGFKNKHILIKLNHSLNIKDGIKIRSNNKEDGTIVYHLFKNGKEIKSALKNDVVEIDYMTTLPIGSIVYKTFDYELSQNINDNLRKDQIKSRIDVKLILISGKPLILNYRINGFKGSIKGNVLASSNKEINIERIKDQLNRLTSTPYIIGNIDIQTDNNCFISISEINQIRNQMVDEINKSRLSLDNSSNTHYELPISNNHYDNDLILEVVTTTAEQKKAALNIPTYSLYDNYPSRIIIKDNENMEMIHNLCQMKEGTIASPYFNITNKESIEVLKECGLKGAYLSLEMNKERIYSLFNNEDNFLGIMAYGRMDAMVSSHCPVANAYDTNKNCGKCLINSYELIDSLGNHLPLILEKNNDCTIRICDYNVINLINFIKELKDHGCKRFLLVFTNESYLETKKIIESFKNVIYNDENINTMKFNTGHFLKPIL